jgi:hypothetical protein
MTIELCKYNLICFATNDYLHSLEYSGKGDLEEHLPRKALTYKDFGQDPPVIMFLSPYP